MKIADSRVAWPLSLAFICFAIGQAVQRSNGNLEQGAIAWLGCSVAAGVLMLVLGAKAVPGAWLERALVIFLGAGVAWEFAMLFSTPPGMYMRVPAVSALFPFYRGLAIAAVLVGAGLSPAQWLGKWRPWLLVVAFLIVGGWMLQISPAPHIDVFFFQKEGAAAFLRGENPYALRYTDIYGNSPFYGPGLSVNGQLQFGFPYFPLGLLLTLPAHLLTNDYRWTQLFAMALSGLVMMTLIPSRVGRAAGALFLFSPRTFFVLEQGWTEPLGVGLLSVVAWCAVKRPKWLPYAFGLLIAIKQYTVFMVPLALLLIPREQWSLRSIATFALKAAIPALLVTVPFVLWNPKEFIFDVVQLQVLQPFRDESLSFLSWWKSKGNPQPSTVWPFVLSLVATGLALWRMPKTIGGFVAAVTVVYLTFFAFNKQAFCNYYYLVIGASALALSLSVQREKSTASAEPSAAA